MKRIVITYLILLSPVLLFSQEETAKSDLLKNEITVGLQYFPVFVLFEDNSLIVGYRRNICANSNSVRIGINYNKKQKSTIDTNRNPFQYEKSIIGGYLGFEKRKIFNHKKWQLGYGGDLVFYRKKGLREPDAGEFDIILFNYDEFAIAPFVSGHYYLLPFLSISIEAKLAIVLNNDNVRARYVINRFAGININYAF